VSPLSSRCFPSQTLPYVSEPIRRNLSVILGQAPACQFFRPGVPVSVRRCLAALRLRAHCKQRPARLGWARMLPAHRLHRCVGPPGEIMNLLNRRPTSRYRFTVVFR
jgi:hypothetical protein